MMPLMFMLLAGLAVIAIFAYFVVRDSERQKD
jgi:hypothetical protein